METWAQKESELKDLFNGSNSPKDEAVTLSLRDDVAACNDMSVSIRRLNTLCVFTKSRYKHELLQTFISKRFIDKCI